MVLPKISSTHARTGPAPRPRIEQGRLRQDLLDDPGGPAVGQALFAAVGVVDEPVVIEAEEVQDRRLEVVGRDDVLGRAVADLVGGAEGHAALDPAAGQPDREALAVVVAAGGRVEVPLADRQPADLAAPVNERRVEQAALLEVLHQRRGRLVGPPADGGQARADAGVSVPRLAAEEELDEPHAALHQPPGDQAARAVLAGRVLVESVEPPDVTRARSEMSSASLAAVCMAAASS